MTRFPVLLLALVVVAGCASTSDTAEKPAELIEIRESVPINRLWSMNLGGSGGLYYPLQPVVQGNHMFAAGSSGRVVRVEVESGRVVWDRNLDFTLTAGPGVADGMVAVTGSNGRVVLLDAETGAERWRVVVSSEVLGVPGVTRGIIGVRTVDQVLVGLDAVTGEETWRIEQSVPSLTMRVAAGVAVVGGEIFVTGFANGRVVGVQARDGRIVWELPFAVGSGRTELERMVDVAATPQPFGRDVFVVSYEGTLAGLAADSGRELWAREFSSTSGLTVGPDGVWVTDSDSQTWGFDRITGSERWRQRALHARAVTAPAAGTGWVAVGDLEGWLHLMDARTGDFVNRVRVDRSRFHSAPVAAGSGLLVAQTGGGTLAVYRVGD
jgi:outer membrane protein assembly factor BamB